MPYADPIARKLYERRYSKTDKAREIHRQAQARYRERNRGKASPPAQRLQSAMSAWGTQ